MTLAKRSSPKKKIKKATLKPAFYQATIRTESGSHDVLYLLRYSRRAKHIGLSQSWGNYLELVLPESASHRVALKFLIDHAPWIEKNFIAQPRALTLEKYLQKHPYINLMGKMVNVRFQQLTASKKKNQKPFFLYHPNVSDCVELFLTNNNEQRTRELVYLMKQIAMHFLKKHVLDLVHKVHAKMPRSISIRDQSSRWGSCSDRKNLSFNWRLLFLEPHIQDYVILHEVAHLTYLNHSKRFWDLLESYDFKALEHDEQMNALAVRIFPLGREMMWL